MRAQESYKEQGVGRDGGLGAIRFCECLPAPCSGSGEKKEDEPKTEGDEKEDNPKAEGDKKEDKAKASSLTEMD